MGVSHCAFFLSALIFLVTADESLFPQFAEPIPNVTFAVGTDVLLKCVVNNLSGYKVAWVYMDRRIILGIHHKIISQNPRLSLSSTDEQSWYLHIKSAQESDRGWYMCHVNTNPSISQKGYLQVIEPSGVIDEKSLRGLAVHESGNVTLVCGAPKYSLPHIKWKREDDKSFSHNGNNVNMVNGRTLSITNVSHLNAGTYLCLDFNGVPPTIVKRVSLTVQSSQFKSIRNQLEDANLEQKPPIKEIELRNVTSTAGTNDWTTKSPEISDLTTSDVATPIFADSQLLNNKVRLARSSNFVSQSPSSAIDEYTNESLFPQFAEPIPNVTVSVGRDALLACVVDNLKGFKVAWVRVDTQTILSIHHNIISQNPRISLSYNDHRSWYLHIKSVQESDRGWYMCQVNTDPMRSRQGYLQVVVPPVIIDEKTSTDLVVRESSNITLVCKASGYPEPYVMWRREDGEDFSYNGENVNVVDGEILSITKVSRLHMGAYLCIASNGVPPSISKRVMLMVQFPPMLSIPNQLEAAYAGQDVALECHTEAYPASINYWTTERGDMILSGDKYEAVSMDSGYTRYMMLKIRRVGTRDFGSYKCVAKNSLGETDGVIRLDEIPAPSTTTSAAPMFPDNVIPMRKKEKHRKKKQKFPLNKVVDDYDNHDWKETEYDFSFASARPPPSALSEVPPLRVTSLLLTFCIFYNLHTLASSHFHTFHRIVATLRSGR